MPGIPPALNNRLRDTLARCGPFDSDAALCALFTDARLSPWRNRIPDNTPNRAARVDALIAALQDQANDASDNALSLFLDVLVERQDPADACHRDLSQLDKELLTVFQPLPIVTQAKNLSTQQRILIAVAIIAVLSIAAILILSILKPKPFVFDEAHFGILVADFVCGAAKKKPCAEGAELAQIAYEDLLRRVQRENLTSQVEIRRISSLQSDEEALSIGESSSAQLVIWGYVPDDPSAEQKAFVPSFVLLKETQSLIAVDPVLFGVRLSGPETFALSQQLAARATAVSNFVLAIIHLTSENRDNYRQASRLLTQAIESTQEEITHLDKTDSRYADLRYTLSVFYAIRGRAYAALDNEDVAYSDYQTALEYDPNSIKPHIGLGNYYYARGDFAAARDEYETAQYLDPRSYAVHYGLAIVAYMQQDYQTAVDLLEGALEIASSQSINTDAAHLVLGVTYHQLGQSEAAVHQFQIILLSDKAPQDLREAACAYLKLQPDTSASLLCTADPNPTFVPASPALATTFTFEPPTSFPYTPTASPYTLTSTPTPTLTPTPTFWPTPPTTLWPTPLPIELATSQPSPPPP